MKPAIELLLATAWTDYELLDSGDGLKLERFGPYVFSRPEPQALWSRTLTPQEWFEAHAEFQPTSGDETGGRWKLNRSIDQNWRMKFRDLVFEARHTNSRHFGVFPEQATQWDWLTEKIRTSKRPLKILNLFGYTGLATLVCAQAGASVTHVDASKKSVGWARENQAYSSLLAKPIRWIVDDVFKYVQREKRRGSFYDGIVMDPPKFGRGPKGEIWESLEMLPELLDMCRQILTPTPQFIVITAYAIRASALSLYYVVEDMMKNYKGETTCGELALKESSANRMISTAIYSRWSAINQ